MQEAEEELGKLPATALVKELKEANQDRKHVLIKVRLKSKNYNFHISVVLQVACTVYSKYLQYLPAVLRIWIQDP